MSDPAPPTETKMSIKLAVVVLLCLFSGLIGSVLSRNFGHSHYTISYADFISVMLTAVSLLMTVLAIFLAVAGFVGWSTIEQKVQRKTEQFLADGFRTGGQLDRMVEQKIESKTEEFMFRGVESIDTIQENANENDEDVDGGSR